MKTRKQLVLIFTDRIGEDYTLRINDPTPDLNEAKVLSNMSEIITSNVIHSKGFELNTPKSAYLREVVITDYIS